MKNHEPITHLDGLSEQEVEASRKLHGANELETQQKNRAWQLMLGAFTEPMVLILVLASALYFFGQEWSSAFFMLGAILMITGISIYQDYRSEQALEKLKDLTLPTSTVIRNGKHQSIRSTQIVIGDLLVVEEGGLVPADGIVIQSNDFAVNESILTGESVPLNKNTSNDNQVFAGSTITRGLGIVSVTSIGDQTKIGAIGKLLKDVQEEKTNLETQIEQFVKKMVWIGGTVFLTVLGIHFFSTYDIAESLLQSLTLAMSVLPEEIPVAFTTFMVLGSWRFAKMGIIAKRMKTVESLGSATVICTDKTGTITENKMTLTKVYSLKDHQIKDVKEPLSTSEIHLIGVAMFASEPIPFDPMEVSLHQCYQQHHPTDQHPSYRMIHEYLLSGTPPLMTHIWEDEHLHQIIAAKGAPEALIAQSPLNAAERVEIEKAIQELARSGYRILGVGQAVPDGRNFPKTQQAYSFEFCGLVAFYDPPKPNVSQIFKAAKRAGVAFKIITGDNQETTAAIAQQIGFDGYQDHISGEGLLQLSTAELSEAVHQKQVFTRMFPEAKLKIIEALKNNGEIVAMIGDGVNDAPALKSAHIGVAMGTKGTEVAKQAADLILLDDHLDRLIEAMAMGRKIYSNLKKAILYIISIHTPIILVVLLPLALGWLYPW